MELEAEQLAALMLSATTPEEFKDATRIVANHIAQRVSNRAWSDLSAESQEDVISDSVSRIFKRVNVLRDFHGLEDRIAVIEAISEELSRQQKPFNLVETDDSER